MVSITPALARRGSRAGGMAVLCLAAALLLLPGCAGVPPYFTADDRRANGLVLILPGIEGRSAFNTNIARGLHVGGVHSAIEVYDWTNGIPGGLLLNLADIERNRRQAQKIAQYIVDYRTQFPGAPVHLVGHSGGGGVAVMALEALPPGRQIDGVFLLAPALSRDYDLSVALRRTADGLTCYYSNADVMILTLGTSALGNIDRNPGVAAGAAGFVEPSWLSAAGKRLYATRLHQREFDEQLRQRGASGSHIGWTSQRFAAEMLAPEILRAEAEFVQRDSRPQSAPVSSEVATR